MNDEANKTGTVDPDLDSGWDLGDGEDEAASARPTVAPPFDLASYAKESMAPSSSNPRPIVTPLPGGDLLAAALRPSMLPKADPPVATSRPISLPPPPPIPRRPVAPPLPGTRPALPAVVAQAKKPATALEAPDWDESFDAAFASNDPAEADTPPRARFPSDSPPSQRITPREMQALEAELALSRQERTTNKPDAPESPGTHDTPAEQPRPNTLLSLANLRAPLLTPPRVAAVSAPIASPAPSPAPPAPADVSVSDPVIEMQERFALGDYSGALVMAESMLEENPTHVEAREYAESCRSVLQQMYTARIGPLDRVPVVDIARDQLRWLSIDHRTGFILSLVDGISSLEMILDVSGMPPRDALRMLFELVQQRIISVRDE